MSLFSRIAIIFSFKPKIIVNLWHLRSMNGMAYHAIDSLNTKDLSEHFFIFRSGTIEARFCQATGGGLCSVSFSLLPYLFVFLPFLFIYSLFWSAKVHCPTCHPLPFVRRQSVVLHDPYPFTIGYLAPVRFGLLFFSLLTSWTTLQYINKSDGLKFAIFMSKLTLSPGTAYVPNRFPEPINFSRRAEPFKHLLIGLVGSASSKKNYSFLIERIKLLRLENISFLVYGFPTSYLADVVSKSPYALAIMNSECHSFGDFFSSVDIIVNISVSEGFCRPVAAAVASDMPVFLLDCPVMNEFYGDTKAFIFKDINVLLLDICNRYPFVCAY